jgi:tetratricopeptide (TPR) repeat protein
MTSDSSEWDEDLPPDPEEDYQTFIRTLERTEGFRLLFVQCTPAEGKQLIARVKEDLPQKTIEVLCLDKPIENLYQIVEQLPNREQVNILFIQGLEHSFYEYEQVKFGNTTEQDFYSWKGVPRILNHLNQHRERFRDTFKICFVFLLRPFSLKYFIHRAPDFFDWRSSVFEFPTTPEILEQESSRLLQEGDYEEYLTLTPEERIKKVLDIQELVEENHQAPSSKASLLLELGNLLYSGKEYEAAIASYNQSLIFKPDDHLAWCFRGNALEDLGRLEEAIASYDQALKIKPNDHYAWYFRGIALLNLGRMEEAVSSYDQAVKIKPDDHQAWSNRGNALKNLGRIEEAIFSYDQAVKIKPDYHDSWYNRGNALSDLGRIEEAISSYDQAVKIKPDDHQAWNNWGNALKNLGRIEEAISSYYQAVKIKPDYHQAWYNRGVALSDLGRIEEAISSYDQAVKIKPDYHEAWNNRGVALSDLGRIEEAISSYDQALKIKPDSPNAFYNKACCYALQGNVDQAMENLQQAMNLYPEKYREMAKTDSDFDSIREDKRFQALIV